jgi:outer membrane protein OmpA-like peptidoglycan-associated protein
MNTIQRSFLFLTLAGILATGCKTMSRSQKGAAVGVAGGAAIGAVIGKKMGNTAAGAVLGAAIGGAAGSIIGKRMDKQAEEMEKVLGDAEIRREGEGIVINFKEKVLFGYDQSVLGSNAQASLDKLANILKKYPDTDIQIIGHTDSKGTARYNQKLSERRASAVSSYLRTNNITSNRISITGMGEKDPVSTNDSDEGRALNRRVEFVITANEKMKEDAKRDAGE